MRSNDQKQKSCVIIAKISSRTLLMTDWHLALALAAGQVSGIVKAEDGRVFVIKGDTYKDRSSKVSTQQDDDGEITEKRIVTDCFIPAIRALDVSPTSDTFGEAFVIR
jgi:hypothetical protein